MIERILLDHPTLVASALNGHVGFEADERAGAPSAHQKLTASSVLA
jgi:hypothetical protein